MDNSYKLQVKKCRGWLLFFMMALVISGITALDVSSGIDWVYAKCPWPWIETVRNGIKATAASYPFLFYGYDWLVFAHIVIAIAFIGPWLDPIRNKWVIQFGMIASLLIIPFAFVMGAIRAIPVWWRLVDCCFGVMALIPLGICWRAINTIEKGLNSSGKTV